MRCRARSVPPIRSPCNIRVFTIIRLVTIDRIVGTIDEILRPTRQFPALTLNVLVTHDLLVNAASTRTPVPGRVLTTPCDVVRLLTIGTRMLTSSMLGPLLLHRFIVALLLQVAYVTLVAFAVPRTADSDEYMTGLLLMTVICTTCLFLPPWMSLYYCLPRERI